MKSSSLPASSMANRSRNSGLNHAFESFQFFNRLNYFNPVDASESKSPNQSLRSYAIQGGSGLWLELRRHFKRFPHRCGRSVQGGKALEEV